MRSIPNCLVVYCINSMALFKNDQQLQFIFLYLTFDAMYTDFKKGCDREDHKVFLEKIAFGGIRDNLWRWFKT